MGLVTLIIILACFTKCIVNGSGMLKIDLKIINATCGWSCDNDRFKMCYADNGGKSKCIELYDIYKSTSEYYQKFETVLTPLVGISLTVLPYVFVIYINEEFIYDSQDRPQDGTTMVLTFQSNTRFIQIGLTSECIDKDHCFGFLCQDCFTKPPIVTVPHSKTGAIGDNVTIPCNISEVYSETTISWIKNNGSVDTIINIDNNKRFVGGTYKSPDLTITSAQKEDEGNYTCHAHTLEFKGSSLPVYLSIFEYPVVNVSNIEPAIEGTNITIPCYVSPTSKVTNITWYKNNSALDIYGNDRFSGGTISSPSLEIYFVEEYDEGNYTCQATNPVGTNESIPTHLTILPDIPTVLTSTEEAVNIGENVTLSCNISSVSELTKIVWFKNNIEFISNFNRSKYDGGTQHDPSLTIHSVQITDEGNYTCNATNAAEHIGRSKSIHLTVFEATTESLPSTDLIFSTSELSTHSFDIISTNVISSTSDLTTLISDTMPSTIETTKSSTVPSSVKTTIATISAHVPSTIETTKPNTVPSSVKSTNATTSAYVPSKIETTKPSTVPSSIKTTITTPSIHLPSTQSSHSSSTMKTSTTTSSTMKSTTTLFSSKPHSTVTSIVRLTTIHTSVSSSNNLPTLTIGSKPPTKITYSSSTAKTSTTTSSTSESPVSSARAVGSTVNSENLNAWVITTTVICVVEFIVIVLVVYILWLRKQRRLALQYEKEETAF